MITSRRLRASAGLAAAVLLTACGGGDVEGSASPASSGSAASSASGSSGSSGAPSSGTDLAPGLLPADAFGPGAQVTPIPEQQLEQGAAAAGGSSEGLQVTPPECDQAVQGTQPSFDEYDDVAAQVAVLGTTTTVQALASGGPAEDAVAGFDDQLGACRSVQVTVPVLVGAVQDGERVVVLVTTDTGGGRLDPTAFTGLLQEAYDTQAQALD